MQRTLRRITRQAPVLWETHAVGERMLTEELEQLRAEGYLLFHNRRLEPGSREVIDTIAIGPPGVFLFDAKHWWGRVFVDASRLIQERRYRRDRTADIDKLLAAAKRVGQITHTYIHPFLVLTGEAQVESGEFVSKVRVRNLANTAGHLRTQIQTLSADDVQRLGALVENNFPHGDAVADVTVSAPRPAESPTEGNAPRRIAVPTLPGFRRRSTGETELMVAPLPAPTLRSPWQPPGPVQNRGDRPRLHVGFPPVGTFLAGVLVLAVLLFVVVDPGSARSRLTSAVTGCSVLDDDAARQALGTRVEGHRRWRGGCTFKPTGVDDAEPSLLVFRGWSANNRADGADKVVVRREDCGVLVVAPKGARLDGVRETADQRAVAAAACVRPGRAKDARDRAQSAAERVVAAIRKQTS